MPARRRSPNPSKFQLTEGSTTPFMKARARLRDADSSRGQKAWWNQFSSVCCYLILYVFGIATAMIFMVISGGSAASRFHAMLLGDTVDAEKECVSSACLQQKASQDFISHWTPSEDCTDKCVFSIVESIPENLTFSPGEPVHLSTYAGLKLLLASARQSVHIASYYWTLRGVDVDFHDGTAAEGEDIFSTLLQLSKEDKISIQIAQNAVNNDTQILADEGHAEVRTLNFTRLIGSGILHTKFWLVDGKHMYIGSANLDWRSLTQVKELGVLVQDCSCLGRDLQKIFDVYWYLGQEDAKVPDRWPDQYSTKINLEHPLDVHFNDTQVLVYMSSSPPPFCPKGRSSDIDAILDVIHQAQQFIYIAVMDYSPSILFQHPSLYWPEIDNALRVAAFNRNVTVRLMASQWLHTAEDMYSFLCSLGMLGKLQHPATHIEVRLFKVPIYSENQKKIPYARVNHNKYMVTDQHAYIGTSNWSGDYFISTGGVGFIVKQPNSTRIPSDGKFRQQLQNIFMRDWFSNYTHDLYCTLNST